MANKLSFFPWYAAEAETDGDWVMMTLAERGLFITLLDYSWINGGLPCERMQIARIARVPLSEFEPLWETVSRKWIPQSRSIGAPLINERQEEERCKVLEKSKKAADSAKARWSKDEEETHMRSHSEGYARASESKSISKSSSLKQETLLEQETLLPSPKPKSYGTSDFNREFEEDWPKFWSPLVGVKDAREAYKKARKILSREELMGHVARHGPYQVALAVEQRRKPIHQSSWLNGCRWTDEISEIVPVNGHGPPRRFKTRQEEMMDEVMGEMK